MKYWKKILKKEFGIYIKTVRLGLDYKGYVMYCCLNGPAGSVKALYDGKVYSEEEIVNLVKKMRREEDK